MKIGNMFISTEVKASNPYDAVYRAFEAVGYEPERFCVDIDECYYYVDDGIQVCVARLKKFNELVRHYCTVTRVVTKLKPGQDAGICGLKVYNVALDNCSIYAETTNTEATAE